MIFRDMKISLQCIVKRKYLVHISVKKNIDANRSLENLFYKGKNIKKSFEVPPRFELGSLDSKSRVLTITPWDRCYMWREINNIQIRYSGSTCSFI